MSLLFDAFWRALAYCLLPRVLLLTLLPLVMLGVFTLGLGFWLWEPAVSAVGRLLQDWGWDQTVWHWLELMHLGAFKTVLPPLLVVLGVTPLLVVLTLLLVTLLTTPTMTALVAQRRFPQLPRRPGSPWRGMLWSLLSTVLALAALVVSVPLWLIPPLVLLLPPLIWGWLTYRVMAYDVLADYASADERYQILHRHHIPLLVMGVVTGYLGAAPGWIWATWALLTPMFVILVPLAVWVYTWVFVLASLWFAHFALAALARLRAESPVFDVDAVRHATAETPTAPADALGWQDELARPGLAPPSFPPGR